MNYQDVIKNSKFYVPMNLNLCFLLKDREIVVLMNVINCDAIGEKLSVRKLMRYTNRSNNKIQDALTELRALKLINGFKPNYEVIKEIFDSLNNAKTIEEKKNWCEVYRKSIQNTVSKIDTENVSKTGTQIKKIDKEDIYKKDKIIYNKEYNIEIENNNKLEENDLKEKVIKLSKITTFEKFKEEVDIIFNKVNTETEAINEKGIIQGVLSKIRLQLPQTVFNRCSMYIDRRFQEKMEELEYEYTSSVENGM